MSLSRPAAADPSPVLRCRDVRKSFSTYRRQAGWRGIFNNFFRREALEIVALDGIDLEVAAGEMVGLIGVNGAGKTTLVKCLTGIIPVSAGEAELFGRDCYHLRDEEKGRLSLVMGQRSQLWWDLPPMDSFRLLAEIYEVDVDRFEQRVAEYAARLEVTDRLGIQLRQLSLGQRMKMEIIGAFLHDPEMVFLDEPTIGLDLISQETIRDFLREINRDRGVTIVLTSHDMEDIEQTCSRLLILDTGRLLYDGDLVGLKRRLVGRRAVEIHLEPHHDPGWKESLPELLAPFGAELVKTAPLHLTFLVDTSQTQPFVKRLFDVLPVRDLNIERQPLEHLIREIFAGREVSE